MHQRPLQALRGIEGPRLAEAVQQALQDRGPALLPLPDGVPEAEVDALLTELRPASLRTPEGVRALPGDPPGVADDTALVVATSGSSGRPKGVELPAGALLHAARASIERIGAPSRDWLCVLPTNHIAGLQVLVRSLLGGGALIRRPFTVEGVLHAAHGRPHVSLVPTQLRRLVEADADLSVFGTILLGGAPAGAELLDAARRAGADVVTTYGMSETCGGCVYDGVPLEDVEVALDPDGRVRLGGPVVAAGYRLRPGLTAEHFTTRGDTRWFATGDLGDRDADGRLTLRGRRDDVIITGGHKVDPGTLAAHLEGHPAVAEAAVVGRADPEWGRRVVALVVPSDPRTPPSPEELRVWTRRRLPRHAAPREVEIRSHLPHLPNGKPDLAQLREP